MIIVYLTSKLGKLCENSIPASFFLNPNSCLLNESMYINKFDPFLSYRSIKEAPYFLTQFFAL